MNKEIIIINGINVLRCKLEEFVMPLFPVEIKMAGHVFIC